MLLQSISHSVSELRS